MLTRLKVTGFKNLVSIDVRFGPFTCIAGPNAVGKSNLFDAIRFLSLLADETLADAALKVRDEAGRTTDIRSLFHRAGTKYDNEMTFEAEMIIPREGFDDLGQRATATTTFVRYRLALAYRADRSLPTLGSLRLTNEQLDFISIRDAPKVLKFPHTPSTWRRSVLSGRRTSPFISTERSSGKPVVKLSQDGVAGRPKSISANNLPRTVLSTVNAAESPTALLARREMQSWRLLQLEPSALREPDKFTTAPGLGADGSHLPATLYYLSRAQAGQQTGKSRSSPPVYDRLAARLSELIDGIRHVSVDRDSKRELLTLLITESDGTVHPARSLSDGTLRFLALAAIDLDTSASGLICLEEPENGIHPKRIPAMISLLQDIATETTEPVGPDNPLRQVVINTHSPAVVNQVPDDSLLVAEVRHYTRESLRFSGARFSWLPDTWRAATEEATRPVPKGRLLDYLNPIQPKAEANPPQKGGSQQRRVIDRKDVQALLPFMRNEE